jgi:thioredoxin reductase
VSAFDVIVVGGGPAGLSAALVLGRCRRRVLVVDQGRPRNARATALHGFLSRDGTAPADFLAVAREQLRPYPTVEVRSGIATSARRVGKGFEVEIDKHSRVTARRLLLATGVVDELPGIKGVEQFYGSSVHHCPYCDGWENRDRALAVYGQHDKGVGLACTLRGWSDDIVLCTDGPADLQSGDVAHLKRLGISMREEPIERLEGDAGQLRAIVFRGGERLLRSALFFNTGQYQRSRIPAQLGCEISDKDSVKVNHHCCTTVPGVYLAGDASRDVQLVIVAAAEGATAAFAINKSLLEEDYP